MSGKVGIKQDHQIGTIPERTIEAAGCTWGGSRPGTGVMALVSGAVFSGTGAEQDATWFPMIFCGGDHRRLFFFFFLVCRVVAAKWQIMPRGDG